MIAFNNHASLAVLIDVFFCIIEIVFKINNNIAVTYRSLANHQRELDYNLKALMICEAVLDSQHLFLAIIYDNISLVLENGTNLRVEAGENLIENISFEVGKDSTLTLKNNNVCEWLRTYAPVKVYVGIDRVKSIRSESFGDISTEKLVTTDVLQIDLLRVSGNIDLELSCLYFSLFTNLGAKINLKGQVANLSIYTLGFGKINATEMTAQNASIKHGGSNSVFVNATQSLKATLESNGNLYYKQEPTIKDIQYFDEGKAFLKP